MNRKRMRAAANHRQALPESAGIRLICLAPRARPTDGTAVAMGAQDLSWLLEP
jgi:hypothetical protein